MQIKHEFPPIWDKVIGAGMNPNPDTVVFTYGDTIYVPGGAELADHIIAHEETHIGQQGADPDAWWSRYIDDQYFRTEQEAEAYAKQYAFLCKRIKDRNQRARILLDLGRILASPMYGKVIDQQAASDMIKKKANVK